MLSVSRTGVDRLAVEGGQPLVSESAWPSWPIHDEGTLVALRGVLESGRWSISGAWTGRITREEEFGRAWAAWNGSRFGVPTANGTSALVIALEALDVGAGDEVIVPALTWVAPATAVMEVNARPVIVDVDPHTACLDVDAVAAALTPRTRAIVAVHLYGSMVDMSALRALASRHGVPIVEDCAQSHGARFSGKFAGTHGDIGVFSMHQGKVLTSGEGGCAVTDDARLARRLEQLRADGRRYLERTPRPGETQLSEVGELQGANRTLSELAAAVLLDALPRLERQNRHREANAKYLERELAKIPGVATQTRPGAVEAQTYYHFLVRCSPSAFAGRSPAVIADAISAELGFWVHPTYPALPAHPLYRPHSKRRFRISEEHWAALDPSRFAVPNADRIHAESVVFHHSALLAGLGEMDLIAAAFTRVQRAAERLPKESVR